GQHKNWRVPERKELFQACLRVAEEMERQGSRVISEEALQQLIREEENIGWLEKFELGGRSLLNRNSDRAFRFSHYTIQEFLLAWGVVNEELVVQEPLRATDQLVRFVDLADGIINHGDQFNFIGFDPISYVQRYGTVCPWLYYSGESEAPEMMILPGGLFRMGGIQGKREKDEGPGHVVELNSFAIGRYPVIFAEYDIFCEAMGREKPDDQGWGREQQPVINVSRQDAVDYCEWLSRETGQTYRLPTEAEWEYACRAGSESAWCFGDDEKSLGEYAWYDKNSKKRTHPVGEKKANAWGLYDMHGNVWEWCQDWYDDEYYAACHKQGVVKNPIGLSQGSGRSNRVIRGGGWNGSPGDVRSAGRDWGARGRRGNDLGFRLALPVQGEQVR
ncbi:MAG: formylglycine-generating enzyme family protein, partial [Candidatus Electrothrix sp. AR5]|nr:formylglycine-generating enzyme family protein [Candidatus Electrothrix sp. AR5]